jgi:hypothetical protein
VIITASLKVCGRSFNRICRPLSSIVSVVVVIGLIPPQQWLSVAYLSGSRFVIYRCGSTSSEPTLSTRWERGWLVGASRVFLSTFFEPLLGQAPALFGR